MCVRLALAKSNVLVVNAGAVPIYVGFTSGNQWGKITWGQAAGCTLYGKGLRIDANTTCSAAAVYDGASTRFCAVSAQPPSGAAPNCALAQTNHQTLAETSFQTAGQCAPIPGPCVWYDISLIPSACTDTLWKANKCAGAGGASYNLPVELSCPGEPTYACRGPTSNLYGPENYPSNCGNPDSYKAAPPVIPQAYFFPMFYPPENRYQPNAVCPGGNVLTITFLAGP